MAKILVTGGAGYIGSHTSRRLLRQGHDVIVVDDLSRGYAHNVESARLWKIHLTDVEQLVRLMAAERFDAVIHFAAYIAVGESTRDPELYFANNVAGTIGLLSAMQKAGLRRMVFSSTAAVYGMPDRMPITEDMPFAPVNPYGESKVMVERMLGWLDRHRDFRSVALRYFNACGAEPDGAYGEEHDPETHLIPLVLRAIATGRPVTVFGNDYETPDGTCIRDYIHVADLAEAHVLALESLLKDGPSDAFNVGTGQGHSVLDVLAAAEAVTGRKAPYEMGPRREGDPPVLVASSAKLQQALGWKPAYTDLTEIVRTAWAFEQKRKTPQRK
ncbi:MAG TPA: UDP-glucose 4-epimerase GalE [Solibacterales bacterium]|nr:UDP-glucose 4-epimerase GalE [Bryobacterales bacterium]